MPSTALRPARALLATTLALVVLCALVAAPSMRVVSALSVNSEGDDVLAELGSEYDLDGDDAAELRLIEEAEAAEAAAEAMAAMSEAETTEALAANPTRVANLKTLKVNAAGLELVKKSEGWRPKFYIDAVGIKTIGYGHACHSGVCSGGMFAKGYLTPQEGTQLLAQDLGKFESCVASAVKVPLSSNEFSALVSLSFNIGCGGFRKSSLLKKLNANNYQVQANFMMWVKGGGRTLPGLVKRRQAEWQLFNSR